jgi:hypothetical protein
LLFCGLSGSVALFFADAFLAVVIEVGFLATFFLAAGREVTLLDVAFILTLALGDFGPLLPGLAWTTGWICWSSLDRSIPSVTPRETSLPSRAKKPSRIT